MGRGGYKPSQFGGPLRREGKLDLWRLQGPLRPVKTSPEMASSRLTGRTSAKSKPWPEEGRFLRSTRPCYFLSFNELAVRRPTLGKDFLASSSGGQCGGKPVDLAAHQRSARLRFARSSVNNGVGFDMSTNKYRITLEDFRRIWDPFTDDDSNPNSEQSRWEI
ncbi:hypothetical protein PGT21_028454 [Puccinia graminis f. sp. tritici]|uniref:Uncharacterized protein n=1 Tax=Puccinia graminis f. sp. tritici TaxID=56615 RepID=A0A5B0PBW7_PUCGR|nr:hypothetical protein PGT21_028454 [Puccinia graminis f. sp. tritici]KAA1116926.1 hypothetical protein PGTUg99_031114 [Puccinia graminis f. sp. tritici]